MIIRILEGHYTVKSQIKIGSVLSYLQMFLSIVIELAYTPIMMRLLGKSEFGLYNTASSTIAMLSVLNLGFSAGYIRYYAKYKHNNDEISIAKLNGLFLSIFSIIGLVAFGCGLYISNNLEIVFANGLTASEIQLAKKLMIILTVNLAISFPMSVFSIIISAHEEFIFLKVAGMLRTICGPLITLPLLLMGYRSIVMVSVTTIVLVITDIVCMLFVVRKLHEKFIFSHWDWFLVKGLMVYTGFIAINIVVDQINSNIDNILLARFKGASEVAVYAAGSRLYTAYVRFSTAISGVFVPRIHFIANSTKDKNELNKMYTEVFIKVGRVQFAILGLIATGLIFFGRQFILYWAGDGYENSFYVTLLLVLPASIALIQNIGIEIQRAENKHQFRSIAYLMMALINFIISLYLCQRLGAVGSTIGTAISLIIANGVIMNIFYYKRCYINILLFWKNILSMSKGMILPVLIGILYSLWSYQRINIVTFALAIMIYTIIYSISMWKFSLNEEEKKLVLGPSKRIIKILKGECK